MIIKEALDAYAKSIDRPFFSDRTKTVGASEVGQCARKTAFVKQAHLPDADSTERYGAKLRGVLIENYFWVPALRAKYGDDLLYAGDVGQNTLMRGYLSATPDALVVNQKPSALKEYGVPKIAGGCFIAEAKSIDPRSPIAKAKEQHIYQVQVQMGLMREKTKHKPNHALISYVDASFLHEISEFVVAFDPKIYANAHKRAETIMTAKDPKDIPPEGLIAGGGECAYCGFTTRCKAVKKEDLAYAEPTDLPAAFVEKVEKLCKEAKQLKETSETDMVKYRTLQEEIKDLLRSQKIRKVPGVVTWSFVKGRTSYDMKGLREAAAEAGVDVESFQTVGEISDQLTIRL